ncbi:hypothetical protein ODJ79_27630 [Actinoplanes sp. KI2]|uniref:hypothetical protein n=1 Tax=Actinoplanes sp. KI2 TaxID=2983315 RepID=UPI0021D58279|nr:hypothetical protein [Actinoplanes sp. KI2]MCU7727506.1 hypothetical protein [Actinoplanes sp. KI2]
MHLAHYLGLLHRAQDTLANALREVGAAHADEADVAHLCDQQAGQCDRRAAALRPFADRYAEDAPDEPERLHSELFRGARTGGLGLLRDLQDLYLMAAECDICWTLVRQAAEAVRDTDLVDLVDEAAAATTVQQAWLRTRMKQAAPQALVVAE